MSSRLTKVACAAALALPLAAIAMPAAQAHSWTPEEDCGSYYSGAVTQHPHTGDTCYGIDQSPNKPGPSGHEYVVVAFKNTLGHFVAYCDNGNVMDKDSLDSAIEDSLGNPGSELDSHNRAVGDVQNDQFSLLCLDDHGDSHY